MTSSRSRHHHRHHAHHSSASRDRSNERTRRPESKRKYNCEHITHPIVALSEMADTISSTKNILKDMLTSVDMHSILAKVDAMEKTVKMFNTRSELPITNSDVHRLLKYSIDDENDDTDTTFDTIMYVIGSHQKQLRALVRNTAEYSRKCQDLHAKHKFKLNPNLKSLKASWTAETVTTETRPKAITSTYRRNLLEELGSETESEEDGHKHKKKGKGKGKNRVSKAPSISSSSSSSSDDDNISPPKQSPRKRKSSPLHLAEAGPSVESNWLPPSQQDPPQTKGKATAKKAKKKKTD